jgi:hypothetical protein
MCPVDYTIPQLTLSRLRGFRASSSGSRGHASLRVSYQWKSINSFTSKKPLGPQISKSLLVYRIPKNLSIY